MTAAQWKLPQELSDAVALNCGGKARTAEALVRHGLARRSGLRDPSYFSIAPAGAWRLEQEEQRRQRLNARRAAALALRAAEQDR